MARPSAETTPAIRSMQGRPSADAVELPMSGPSPATIRAMLLGVGLGGLGLGALVAWSTLHRSALPVPPITPVGLFGEPSSVVPAPPATVDAAVLPTRSTAIARAPRVARPTTAGSNVVPDATPPSAEPNAARSPPPETTALEAPTPEDEPAPRPTATAPTTAASNPAPVVPAAEPSGLREHVPGTPASAGFRPGDETDATGHMDPAAFRFVYQHYHSQIASCYSSATRNTEVSGVIVVRVRVGEDGHVRRTRIISDGIHDATLTRCVQTSIQSWRYPQPEGGDVEVDYPMRFGSAR